MEVSGSQEKPRDPYALPSKEVLKEIERTQDAKLQLKKARMRGRSKPPPPQLGLRAEEDVANTGATLHMEAEEEAVESPSRHASAPAAVHDPLALPSKEVLRQIEEKQDVLAREAAQRRRQKCSGKKDADKEGEAATLIQRNYRGYRARRELRGWGLDSSSRRWTEALKEAKYLNSTRAMSRSERSMSSPTAEGRIRDRWRRVGTIAHRAGSDYTSSESEMEDEGVDSSNEQERERRRKERKEREKYAKVMGLEYFLEMVDHKHRYGSNLRRYHAEWKKSSTDENFFYWLDYGEGKSLDLADRPRARLDTECVRYLSREERQRYLVRIDPQGRFLWAKNDHPITTSPEFKDSINGIVPITDPTPTWREVTTGTAPEPSPPGSSPSSCSSLSDISTGSQEDASKYTNTTLHDAPGLAKLQHLSADALMNHMLRKTTKKNVWIFAEDTSGKIFIGIKQSGAFQHSSFLRGARVAAAGLIKIKRGQLRKLSPLSGHYAPPLRNFREFVRHLRTSGADLGHLNLGRSYAVLLGLEGYVGTKKSVKEAQRGVKDVLDPDGKKAREEAERDKSLSAARERAVLAEQERERKGRRLSSRILRRLGLEKGEKGG